MPEFAMRLPEAVSRYTGMKRGFRCRCPACGEGRLFGRYLKVNHACARCGTEFHHHRADDMPPYIVMFIVGHVIGYCVLVSETRFEVPLSVQIAVWPALTLALCLALLQPVKGAIIGLQFALGMHGFGPARALAEKGFATDGEPAAMDAFRDAAPR